MRLDWMKRDPPECSWEFSNSLNMKTPNEHVLVWARKIHESVTLSSIILSSLQACQKWRETWVDFHGLVIILIGKIRKKYSLWVINNGSMSSLNITLSEISNTHVLVYIFSLAITSSFLLLNFSFIHGESDHVPHMKNKYSCPICKLKYSLRYLCVVLTVQGFIPSFDY